MGTLGVGDDQTRGLTPESMGTALPYVLLGTGRSALRLALGGYSTCAVLDNGQLKCWGANWYGELGYGDTLARGSSLSHMGDNLPAVNVGTNRTVRSVTLGHGGTCALLDNWKVKCWGTGGAVKGLGHMRDIGDGPNEMGDDLPYVDVGVDYVATSIEIGGMHTCAILAGGQIKCWGGAPTVCFLMSVALMEGCNDACMLHPHDIVFAQFC